MPKIHAILLLKDMFLFNGEKKLGFIDKKLAEFLRIEKYLREVTYEATVSVEKDGISKKADHEFKAERELLFYF